MSVFTDTSGQALAAEEAALRVAVGIIRRRLAAGELDYTPAHDELAEITVDYSAARIRRTLDERKKTSEPG